MPHRRPAPRPRGCLSKTIAAAGLSAPRAGVAADRIDEVITTNSSIIEKAEKETIEDTMFNYLMMSLRLKEELDLDEFKRRCHCSVEDVYKEALTKNLGNHSLIIENNHLKTNDTLDLLNSILLDFLPE